MFSSEIAAELNRDYLAKFSLSGFHYVPLTPATVTAVPAKIDHFGESPEIQKTCGLPTAGMKIDDALRWIRVRLFSI